MSAGEIAMVVAATLAMLAAAWGFTKLLNWICPEEESE